MAKLPKRPRRLKNIHVEEVSFVDAGANQHRLIIKSEQVPEDAMQDQDNDEDFTPVIKSTSELTPAQKVLADKLAVVDKDSAPVEASVPVAKEADAPVAVAKEEATETSEEEKISTETLVSDVESLANFALSKNEEITDSLVDALEGVLVVADQKPELTAVQKSAVVAIAATVLSAPRAEGSDQAIVVACFEKLHKSLTPDVPVPSPASARLQAISKALSVRAGVSKAAIAPVSNKNSRPQTSDSDIEANMDTSLKTSTQVAYF